MSRFMTFFAIAACALLLLTSAAAQKSTERYIPIGKSPGLSGKYTIIARITNVNMQEKSVTMADSAGSPYTVLISGKTQIWSDRSGVQKTNERILLGDCRVDMWCEVKYMRNERRENGTAEWMKVRMNQ